MTTERVAGKDSGEMERRSAAGALERATAAQRLFNAPTGKERIELGKPGLVVRLFKQVRGLMPFHLGK